jgi:hypothetical protein
MQWNSSLFCKHTKGCQSGADWQKSIGPHCLCDPDAWRDQGLSFGSDLLSIQEYASLSQWDNSCESGPPSDVDEKVEIAAHKLMATLVPQRPDDQQERQVTVAVLRRRFIVRMLLDKLRPAP